MGDLSAGERVDFDFEGSLQLARQLWALARDIEGEALLRQSDYETAIAAWKGPYGTEFTGRRDTEKQSESAVVSGLEADARAWAQAWATALDQQNKNNRAAEVIRVREDRPWYEKLADSTFGEDDSESQVGAVPEITTPVPPSFQPTATETTY